MLRRYALIALATLAMATSICSAFDDVAERTYYNPYTGNYNRSAVAYNPYTGRDAAVRTTTPAYGTTTDVARGAAYNPYTGNYHGTTATTTATGTREESKTYYNPATGRSESVQGAYNPYTGKYAYHYSYRR